MSWRCLVLEQWAERSDDSNWRLDGLQEVVPLNVAFLVAQTVKHLSAMLKTRVWSLGQEDPWRRNWQPTPVQESDTTEWPYLFLCYPRYHWLSISSFSNWKDLLHITKIHWRVLKSVQRQNSRILATEANRYQISIFPFIHVRLYI